MNFWKQINVVGGLSLIVLSYLSVAIMAIVWPEAYKLIEPQLTVKLGAYSLTINQIVAFAGLMWLLSPKIGEVFTQILKNRIGPK